MQNHSTEYLQQASSILQQACDDGTQELQRLLYATEVRPLQSTPVQNKFFQTHNTSNNIQQTSTGSQDRFLRKKCTTIAQFLLI